MAAAHDPSWTLAALSGPWHAAAWRRHSHRREEERAVIWPEDPLMLSLNELALSGHGALLPHHQ